MCCCEWHKYNLFINENVREINFIKYIDGVEWAKRRKFAINVVCGKCNGRPSSCSAFQFVSRSLFSVNKFHSIGHFIHLVAAAAAAHSPLCYAFHLNGCIHNVNVTNFIQLLVVCIIVQGRHFKHHILFTTKLLHFSSFNRSLLLPLIKSLKFTWNKWALWQDDDSTTYWIATNGQNANYYQFNLHFKWPNFATFCSDITYLKSTSNKLNIITIFLIWLLTILERSKIKYIKNCPYSRIRFIDVCA